MKNKTNNCSIYQKHNKNCGYNGFITGHYQEYLHSLGDDSFGCRLDIYREKCKGWFIYTDNIGWNTLSFLNWILSGLEEIAWSKETQAFIDLLNRFYKICENNIFKNILEDE